jgi:hypothetical protein
MSCPSFLFYCQGSAGPCCSIYTSKYFGVHDFHLSPKIAGPVQRLLLTISPPPLHALVDLDSRSFSLLGKPQAPDPALRFLVYRLASVRARQGSARVNFWLEDNDSCPVLVTSCATGFVLEPSVPTLEFF